MTDWIDKYGACKVCEGEIPYGHQPSCSLYKKEKEIERLQKLVDRYEPLYQAVTHAGGVEFKIIEQQQTIERLWAALERAHELIKQGRYHAADAELEALRDE